MRKCLLWSFAGGLALPLGLPTDCDGVLVVSVECPSSPDDFLFLYLERGSSSNDEKESLSDELPGELPEDD